MYWNKHVLEHVNYLPLFWFFGFFLTQVSNVLCQEEDAKVQTEMTELLGEIRMTMKDSGAADCTGIPLELTERWIGTTAKQLHATFNLHFSIVQHLARHLQPKARAGISGS
jgi:hypothetical protein